MDSDVHPVLFSYRARVPGPVALVGSFNNWDPRVHRLKRVGRDWRIVVYLPPGTYPYAFVTNGQLVRDPHLRRSSTSTRDSVPTIEISSLTVPAAKDPPSPNAGLPVVGDRSGP